MLDTYVDIYVYTMPLPLKVNELVTPCCDGYTVWLSDRLDDGQREKALRHAIRHIMRGDFEKTDVQQVEADAHGKE